MFTWMGYSLTKFLMPKSLSCHWNKRVTMKSIKLMSSAIQLLTVILCIYPYNRHHLEEHLGLRFSQSHVFSVPASSFQIQPIHVDTFHRRACDIILHPFSNLIAQHYTVQSPSFVSPCYFLPKTDRTMIYADEHRYLLFSFKAKSGSLAKLCWQNTITKSTETRTVINAPKFILDKYK